MRSAWALLSLPVLALIGLGCNRAETPKKPETVKVPPVKATDKTPDEIRAEQRQVLVRNATPNPRGMDGWKPTETTAEKLAAEIDDRLARLKNAEVEWVTTAVRPEGVSMVRGKNLFAVPKNRFRLEFPEFGKSEREGIEQGVIVADGQATIRFGLARSPSIPQVGIDPWRGGKTLDLWPDLATALVFSPFISGRPALTEWVREAKASATGLDVSTDERSTLMNGKRADSLRLHAERTESAENRAGKWVSEVVIDRQYRVPTSIRVRTESRDGKVVAVETRFRWNLSPSGFPSNAFELKR